MSPLPSPPKLCDSCSAPVAHNHRAAILYYKRSFRPQAIDLCAKCAGELVEFIANTREGSPTNGSPEER